MSTQSVIQRAFASGEIAPALAARADQTRYLTGLRRCRNFIVQRHGGVTKRSGTKFVAAVKDSSAAVRLMTFIFEAADQTYVLEFGNLYVRFYWHGAPVVSGMAPLELVTPYTSGEVGQIQATQSADILLLVHPNHPPQELKRTGPTTWTIGDFVVGPTVEPPAGVGGTVGLAGALSPVYVVTTSKVDTYEESFASTPFVLAGAAIPTTTTPNAISWSAASDAAEYNVYCDPYGNGIFGFLGSTSTTSFNDVGFLPDFTLTPPTPVDLFNATGDYPSAASYYQQRLFFANSNNKRENLWGSRVGAYHNFSISTPVQDDDAVTFILAQKTLSPVVDLVPLKRLLVLTDTGEWSIQGDADGVITPSTINADPQGYAGASASVRPLVIGNEVLYVQARGTVLRALKYNWQVGGFTSLDLTLFATHLFAGFTLDSIAFAQQPNAVVWAVRSDGTLLGFTYVPDQEITAWHRHDTGASGVFEQVVSIPNTAAGEDDVYVVVKRTINGNTVRYIERFSTLQFATPSDWFYVDAGLTYSGSAVNHVSGLDHLEGQVVAVLADGNVLFDGDPTSPNAVNFTVTGGALPNFSAAYSVIHAGLPIRFPELETLDLDVQGSAIRDKKKRVMSLTAIVDGSTPGFLAGPDANHLLKHRSEAWRTPQTTVSAPLEINLTDSFKEGGRVWIRHTDPTPFTLLALLPNLEVGG